MRQEAGWRAAEPPVNATGKAGVPELGTLFASFQLAAVTSFSADARGSRLQGECMRQKGFTLVELMLVVAIIALLAAIALPAYQDYVVRAQVVEGMKLSSGARMAIASYHGGASRYPVDNQDAGLAQPGSISGRYVQSVTLDASGNISVLFGGGANAVLQGQTLSVQVIDNDGSLRWECSGLPAKYLPSACR